MNWYVIVGTGGPERVDGYPLQIYADRKLADAVAAANGERVVVVAPIEDEKQPN